MESPTASGEIVTGGVSFGPLLPHTPESSRMPYKLPQKQPMPKDEKKPPSPASLAIDALIEAFRDGEEEYTYEVERFGTVRARRMNDASEMVAITNDLEKYHAILSGALPCPATLAEYKGVDYHVLTLCIYGARLLVEPKLSVTDLLRLSRKAGKGLFALCTPLLGTAAAEDALEASAAIETEGNG